MDFNKIPNICSKIKSSSNLCSFEYKVKYQLDTTMEGISAYEQTDALMDGWMDGYSEETFMENKQPNLKYLTKWHSPTVCQSVCAIQQSQRHTYKMKIVIPSGLRSSWHSCRFYDHFGSKLWFVFTNYVIILAIFG